MDIPRQLTDIADVWNEKVMWPTEHYVNAAGAITGKLGFSYGSLNTANPPSEPKTPLRDGDAIIVRTGGRLFRYSPDIPLERMPRDFIVVRLKDEWKHAFDQDFVSAHVDKVIKYPQEIQRGGRQEFNKLTHGSVQQTVRISDIRKLPIGGIVPIDKQKEHGRTWVKLPKTIKAIEDLAEKNRELANALARRQPDLRRLKDVETLEDRIEYNKITPDGSRYLELGEEAFIGMGGRGEKALRLLNQRISELGFYRDEAGRWVKGRMAPLENRDYQEGFCHQYAVDIQKKNPELQMKAAVSFEDSAEADDDYGVIHVWVVDEQGRATDSTGTYASEEGLFENWKGYPISHEQVGADIEIYNVDKEWIDANVSRCSLRTYERQPDLRRLKDVETLEDRIEYESELDGFANFNWWNEYAIEGQKKDLVWDKWSPLNRTMESITILEKELASGKWAPGTNPEAWWSGMQEVKEKELEDLYERKALDLPKKVYVGKKYFGEQFFNKNFIIPHPSAFPKIPKADYLAAGRDKLTWDYQLGRWKGKKGSAFEKIVTRNELTVKGLFRKGKSPLRTRLFKSKGGHQPYSIHAITNPNLPMETQLEQAKYHAKLLRGLKVPVKNEGKWEQEGKRGQKVRARIVRWQDNVGVYFRLDDGTSLDKLWNSRWEQHSGKRREHGAWRDLGLDQDGGMAAKDLSRQRILPRKVLPDKRKRAPWPLYHRRRSQV